MGRKDYHDLSKIDRFIELSSELARIALDCPACSNLFRKVMDRYGQIEELKTAKEGGSLSDFTGQTMNVRKDGLTNESIPHQYK